MKLVRDRIPEIMREAGVTPIIRTASSEEYFRLLKEKLVEEANEFLESENMEELADVYEVLINIIKHKGLKYDDIEILRTAKNKERGSFNKRIVLE
jgi:predicted house-cleaning noncanonical NTP pyrophosphatase (MazG superfamily)